VLITAAVAAAVAVAVTLALADHPAEGSHASQPAAFPGRWVDGQTRATADQATCVGHARAAALLRSAALVSTADTAGHKAATDRYDQAAATMYRATTIETHFDLSSAAQTFTAALRTLVVAPSNPEAFAAAAAADQTVTAMCASRTPAAAGGLS